MIFLAELAVPVLVQARASVEKGKVGKDYCAPFTVSPRSIHGHVGLAIHAAYTKRGTRYGLGLYCWRVVTEACGGDQSAWNDARGRSKDEFLAVLDVAIGIAEAEVATGTCSV